MRPKFIEKCFVAGVAALLFAGAAARAEVTYFVANLTRPGTLEEVVTYNRLVTLDSLVVVGRMGLEDFDFLKCEGGVHNGKLSVLNLENAQLTWIPERAFAPDRIPSVIHPNLKRVILPNSVEDIGDRAFVACTQLSTINLPASLKWIRYAAFCNCHNLTSIILPDGRKEILPSNIQYVGSKAFAYCENLTGKVKIPENAEILSETFSGTGITEVEFPEHPGTIGWGAFESCKLRRVHIPESARSCCAGGLFAYNELLEEINIPLAWDTIPVDYLKGCVSLKSLTLPPALTTIGWYALQGCTSLESLTLPPTLIEIGESALQGCSSLKSLTLPSSLTSIGENAFFGCSSLKSLTIPNSVTELPAYVLSGCTSLEEVVLPEDMEIISDDLLSDCPSLKSIRLPQNLHEMKWGALRNDSSLTQIAFPEGFTSISGNALRSCASLKTIILPSSFRGMQNYSFGELPSLEAVYCKALRPPVKLPQDPGHSDDNIPFRSTAWGSSYDSPEMRTNPNATIYIPKGSLDAYRNSKDWKYFTNFVELEDDQFPSGIDDIPAQSIRRISVSGDGLTVSGVESPERYDVYDITGRHISTGVLTPGDNRIALPSGLYIFTSGGHSEKIRVR